MLQEAVARPAYPAVPAKPDATLVNDWHVVGYSTDVKDGTSAARIISLTYVIGLHAVTIWNHRRRDSDGHGYWLHPVNSSGVNTSENTMLIRCGTTSVPSTLMPKLCRDWRYSG